MKIHFSYRERMFGLFLFFSLLGLVALFFGEAIQQRWFAAQVDFHMHLNNGADLHKGAPVLLSGIEVGEVSEIALLQDNRVDVKLIIHEQFAYRIRKGTKVKVRRYLGVGKKQIYLETGDVIDGLLPPDSLLPVDEHTDMLDAISALDIDHYFKTVDRFMSVMATILDALEEEDRLERMLEAFDQVGPTMERVNEFLTGIHEPIVELLNDPSLRRTFKGLDSVLNDPSSHKAMHSMANSFDPKKVAPLMERADHLLARFDHMLAKDGHLAGAFSGMDRLLNDERTDHILTALDKLSDVEKLEKLRDNIAILTEQMAVIGPEIPKLSKEMITVLREAVIVLRALQKTRLLKDESEEVRKGMQ